MWLKVFFYVRGIIIYITSFTIFPPPISSSPLLFSLSLFSWKSFHTTQPAIDESLRGSFEGFYIPSSTFFYLYSSIPRPLHPSLVTQSPHSSPYSSPHSLALFLSPLLPRSSSLPLNRQSTPAIPHRQNRQFTSLCTYCTVLYKHHTTPLPYGHKFTETRILYCSYDTTIEPNHFSRRDLDRLID